MVGRTSQLDLFGGAPQPVGRDRAPIGSAEISAEHVSLGERLEKGQIRLGTSSWSFPGWKGIVWDREVAQARLASEGLGAYASHPLLRCVGVDRTYYAPVPTSVFEDYASRVPADFRFVVKAHEWLTVSRFPSHPRYGALRGQENPHFLDARHAIDNVVAPYLEGLKEKGGALVFQFAPQRIEALGGVEGFAERLHGFLRTLPQGPLYAVEVRNPDLMSDAYAAALRDTGAAHVVSAWAQMPGVAEQARRVPVLEGPALVGRWMLPPGGGLDYEEARERFAPFDRLQDEDPVTRRDYAALSAAFAARGKPSYVIVNNKAEGSAPLSVFALAKQAAEAMGE